VILEDSDLPIIQESLQDYQWWVENFPGFYIDSIVLGPMRPLNTVRKFQARRAKIEHQGPLIARVLAGELPDSFNLIGTLDCQWSAWCPGSVLGLFGPTTEFQARLWCLTQSQLKNDVKWEDHS